MKWGLVAFTVVAACGPARPQGYSHPEVDGITIVSEEEAAKFDLLPNPHELALGPTSGGDPAIIDFLATARARGAAYVSSIEIHVGSAGPDGAPLECVTRVGPKHEVDQRLETEYTPARTEYVQKTRPVTRTRTEYRWECETVSRPHVTTETDYEYEYDPGTGSSRSVPRSRTVTEYRSEQECSSKPYDVTETDYESETEAVHVPAETNTVVKTYSHWELVSSAPVCRPVDPAASAQNRILGTIYVARPSAAVRSADARRARDR
jgi:hypothetical protein